MSPSLWALEIAARQKGFLRVAGIDEAGRGPLAGPVVAAAVILPEDFDATGVDDSKKLTPKKRDLLFDRIRNKALAVGTGIIGAEEIDRINILAAALKAMALATEKINPLPDFLLIDGPYKIPHPLPQQAIISGDSLSVSIACASIVAKVTRDRMMEHYDGQFPGYNFKKHKGYGTKEHRQAIQRLGPSPIHRKSFTVRPVED
ncbi:MAG: ribonuclease HII [Desulfatibacillaceae bacterium]|nr:ribonuclease HII [Desulfatibacillaceae bacterium]